MRAELQIFSGRPSPSWELTGAEVTGLARRLHRLPAAAHAPAQPALGYRGVAVVNAGDARGLPDLHVFRGVVTTTRSGERILLADTEMIEQWLWRLARKRGFGSVVDQISGAESAPNPLFRSRPR